MKVPLRPSIRVLVCLGALACPTTEPEPPPTRVDPKPVRVPTPGIAWISRQTPVPCAEPARREVAWWTHRKAPKLELGPAIGVRLVGGALAVGDFDNNGHLDVLVPGERSSQLHLNQGAETFNEVASTHLAGVDLTATTSLVSVDIDQDGDLDVYVTRFQRPNRLLINDGTGRFTDGTAAFPGIDAMSGWNGAAPARRSLTAAFGDMDGDGDLDLFVGAYGPRPEEGLDTGADFTEIADPAVLLENDGGTFIDRSERLPAIVHDGYNFNAAWLDVDDDNDPELLVIHDFGWARPSQLLLNDGAGGLTPAPRSAGFNIAFAGMGLGIGDLNGDAIPDFAQSSWKEASVLRSLMLPETAERPGFWDRLEWWDTTAVMGVVPDLEAPRNQIFGWGTAFADVDNDGDLDLPMTFGYWDEYRGDTAQRDALWVWDGARYLDLARQHDVDDDGAGRALSTADINGDGWPDLVKRQISDATPMHLSACGAASWLHVRLRAPAPNRDAIGARIAVTTGGVTRYRWIQAGGQSMMTGEPPEALFGLGDATVIDRVEVRWPDGRTSTHGPLAPAQRVEISLLPPATPKP